MKRFTLAGVTAALAAVSVLAATALGARGTSIAPHVYSTKIAGATPAVLNGTWRLSMNRTAFSVTKGASLAVGGSVKIVGNRITFHDIGGPFACHGAQATGVYSYRIAGKRLTLTAVKEPCAGRKTILTKPFTRIQ